MRLTTTVFIVNVYFKKWRMQKLKIKAKQAIMIKKKISLDLVVEWLEMLLFKEIFYEENSTLYVWTILMYFGYFKHPMISQ